VLEEARCSVAAGTIDRSSFVRVQEQTPAATSQARACFHGGRCVNAHAPYRGRKVAAVTGNTEEARDLEDSVLSVQTTDTEGRQRKGICGRKPAARRGRRYRQGD
jgi:hypothetical protein